MLYHLLALLACAIWGVTFVSTKVLLNAGLSPAMIFFLRFLVAYVCLLPLCRKPLLCPSWRDELLCLVLGLFGGNLFYFTENTALLYTQSGNVSFISSMSPLFLAIYGVMRPGHLKSSWAMWMGTALALVGIFFIIGGVDHSAAPNPLLGNVIALVSALLWCVYTDVVTRLSPRYSSAFLSRKLFFYGALTAVPLIASEVPALPHQLSDATVIGNLLFLSLAACLLCYYLWNAVISHLGSVASAGYLYTIPLVTCLFSYLVLDEQITASMLFGGVCVIAGVFFTSARSASGSPRR